MEGLSWPIILHPNLSGGGEDGSSFLLQKRKQQGPWRTSAAQLMFSLLSCQVPQGLGVNPFLLGLRPVVYLGSYLVLVSLSLASLSCGRRWKHPFAIWEGLERSLVAIWETILLKIAVSPCLLAAKLQPFPLRQKQILTRSPYARNKAPLRSFLAGEQGEEGCKEVISSNIKPLFLGTQQEATCKGTSNPVSVQQRFALSKSISWCCETMIIKRRIVHHVLGGCFKKTKQKTPKPGKVDKEDE